MERLVRDFGHSQRHKHLARALAVAFVACASTMTAGCAHIDALFNATEEPELKPVLRKPMPVKVAVIVTPERRAQADALHASALHQMSRGAVGPAVSNLTRAAKLDPTNDQIRRDLVRANRIRSAVGAGEAPLRRSAAD